MGSLGAMSKGSSDRYFQSDNTADKLVPEGIEGRVAYKGRLKEIIHQQMGGLRACMGLTGCGTIDELRTKTEFVRIDGVRVFRRNHVHDVTITKGPRTTVWAPDSLRPTSCPGDLYYLFHLPRNKRQ